MKPIFEPWIIPNVNSDVKYTIEAIHDDFEGFRILLRSENLQSDILRITFENYISYKNTNENYLLKLWEMFDDKILGRTFYKVRNSEFIDIFNKLSFEIYDNLNVEHYAIYTLSDCLDILAIQPPKIKWL